MSGIQGLAVPGGAGAVIARPGRRPPPSVLQAVLILVRVLFVVTVVGTIDVLTVASSVDAVDGRLLGMLLYAALPGTAGFVLSLYVRTGGGVWIWRGLLAVHVWLAIGGLASLSGDGGGQGVPQLVMPIVVAVLLFHRSLRAWFELSVEQRGPQKPFILLRSITSRRDRGQSAMEYLGTVLVVVALVGALMATEIGGQLTGEIRSAICQLTGSACSASGGDVVAGHGAGAGGGTSSGGGTGSGDADSGGSAVSGGSDSGGSDSGGSVASGGTDSGGSAASGGTDSGGSAASGGAWGTDSGPGSGDLATQAGKDNGRPNGTERAAAGGGFFTGLVGDGLWGDVSGAADTVLHPVTSGRNLGDQVVQYAQSAKDKWSQGDRAGAVGDLIRASTGAGRVGVGLPGSGSRVGAVVQQAERDYLNARIPLDATPAGRKAWWGGLTPDQRDRYLAVSPDRIGNLDGIPAATRDTANRENLRELMRKLEGQDDAKSKEQLAGLREIDRQLKENGKQPPMFLLGIGDEGNGRAIVSYGNPDTSKNVSAYVPGLNTSLDEEFAKNDLKRARDTAIGAQGYDRSSAAIVWLGYDAPQSPDGLGSLAVMGDGRAVKGGAAYSDFMGGIAATNQNKDPHLTAIGHSYGSRTVGAATQRPGGIPGVDDIVLVGSPGVGVDHAVDLGVGAGHVFVGAAANDPVTKLPSRLQSAVGAAGLVLAGPAGAYLAGDLADPGDDDLWFGKDPASKAFGARRFPVADGPPVISSHGLSGEAHSQYFDPVRDAMSADSIALIVSGHSNRLKMEEQR
ncbi:alpha/beta hydrolase [Streptomyces sp. NPDC057291]|uniref:alpha/beta hydrolase n=1 Tax=Streptomyces sp. NPDC057291 TaxID=3346087 RepID=UPI003634085C